MKLKSFASLAIVGAACLAFGTAAYGADGKKNTSTGKSTIPEIVTPTKNDVVIWVDVTGSRIPQRYVVRNGQILNTATNTTMILLNSNVAASYTDVAGILLSNVPDIRRR